MQELDKETFQVIMEKKQEYDSDGNYYNYEIPQEFKLFNVWWKPWYYERYDDLYLNKVFETQFKTDFLYHSGLFANLQKGYIRNRNLLDNKHIYAEYFAHIVDDQPDFVPVKVPFMDNPSLNIHLFLSKTGSILRQRYYFKDIALALIAPFQKARMIPEDGSSQFISGGVPGGVQAERSRPDGAGSTGKKLDEL